MSGVPVPAHAQQGCTDLEDEVFLQSIRLCEDLEETRIYLDQCPGGSRASEAAKCLAWDVVKDCTDREGVEQFVRDHPKGPYSDAAQACLAKLPEPDIVGLLGRPLFAEAQDRETWWTDLHHAAAADLADAVGELVSSGVPVDARLASGPSFGDHLVNVLAGLGHGMFENWTADGETPLMIASHVGALGAAEALVAHGANIHAGNDYGITPPHFAAWGNAVEVARFLVDRGADIHGVDNYCHTPLHDAARGNALDVVRWLVEQGADIHARDDSGKTPLQRADGIDDATARAEMKELLRSLGATH